MKPEFKVIAIGGSAGCFDTLRKILSTLPEVLDLPIIIVIHRQKNVVSELDNILSQYASNRRVVEPDDKEMLQPNCIYLAPQNYHLLIEKNGTLSLDYSEAIHYSRPSIDVTFESVAQVYGSGALGILLSGANLDGTAGIKKIVEKKGVAIVQDPTTTTYSFMPQNAINAISGLKVLSPDAITDYLQGIKK
jgi:two-component system chemotaxis response regulator CheB